MAVSSTPTLGEVISDYILNPEARCLAFREGRWTVINASDAQQGFFAALFSSPPVEKKVINSISLSFEKESLEKIDEAFNQAVRSIYSCYASHEDEGFVFADVEANARGEAQEALPLSPEQLVTQINLLFHQLNEGVEKDYRSLVARYREIINKYKEKSLGGDNIGLCDKWLSLLEHHIAPATPAAPAGAPAGAAAVEAPVDEAREMRHAVIARMRARGTDIRKGIAEIDREIELLREQRLQETLQQIAGASRPLGQASTQFERTVPSFRVYDKDPGRALEIFNETADLANAVTAQRAYETKYDSLRQLVETLETAVREASAFRDQMLQNPHEFSDDLQVTQSINRLGRDIDALQANLDLLNGEYSTQVRETSSYTKIRERYEKRQEILHQATAALNAYTGPAPILLSIENGQLKVEKKPFSVFGQPKGVELMTLPNGMTFAIKQQSKDDLTKLFNLAFSPVSRDNPVSSRFLEGHRQDFESALQSKLSK